ncbi:FAD-dependent 5-carboxymethylaminomethyl-2-thiouridine(34) oxidoreductase MnmC [Rhodospirillaceae bacterium KN72]|uniref:tRNA 5-methylaminomethyl-2-thiouridine biosynthesis bifunctional protein MnmC n=1 Tax=Pacificispira spongiicola TaxID=2729598 RepID=A0A7Y0E2J0_9PROT|nr:FAD-dependent 5-carboxymethylaminomethyl-2-thiouridine(34) oxidoreductase MnmC [Pacificispira spongiicola]NMM46050.1 FAD-dependent 5-carboxymethylaminomethyl-2-thiouridine(34) oxidoreductase MnmC [Pacificispira spongiicola]
MTETDGQDGHDPDAIDWRDGIPYAARFGDLYYSAEDPRGEVQHTFLDGVDFDALCRQPTLTIAETGFGTGLNFLEAWQRWEALASPDAQFTFISVEAFPMSQADLEQAHALFPALADKAAQLRRQWPGFIRGSHLISLSEGRIRLILLIGEAEKMFAARDFTADAWFLDGFAPAQNPDMWRDAVFHQIARLSRPGTKLASFTAAGMVRRGLAEVGFDIVKRPGFGRKRDCIAGTLEIPVDRPASKTPWTKLPTPRPGARIAVIGAGIAGRCLGASLINAGFETTVIQGPESRAWAASTLPRALIAPKLIRGDQPYPRFWRQAYLDALRVLDGIAPDIWCGPRGLIIPAPDQGIRDRQAALKGELAWPTDILRQIDSSEAADRLGRACPGGLFLPGAGILDPSRLLERLVPDTTLLQTDVKMLSRTGGRWSLHDGRNTVVATADVVILACGPGAVELLPEHDAGYGLRIGSGQLFQAQGATASGISILHDGYVGSTDASGVFVAGATSEGWQNIGPVPVDPAATDRIQNRLADYLPDFSTESMNAWTGLRCDTVDHLPLAGPVQNPMAFETAYDGLRHGKPPEAMPDPDYEPGLFCLTGLGARGFQAAFTLADQMTAMLSGNPLPLDRDMTDALLPNRFQIRNLRRNL